MRRRMMQWVGGVSLMTVVGCAASGDIIPIQVQPLIQGQEKRVAPGGGLRVAVTPFEDGRSHKDGLGTRTHLWGGVSYFTVPGGNSGETVARALVTFLESRGWQAELVKPGAPSSGADVALSGMIQELAVSAKSGVGSTKIATQSKLNLQARNLADGSLIKLTLDGAGSDRVFWFSPEDVQAVLNDELTQSFGRLVQSTQVKDERLLLK